MQHFKVQRRGTSGLLYSLFCRHDPAIGMISFARRLLIPITLDFVSFRFVALRCVAVCCVVLRCFARTNLLCKPHAGQVATDL